MEGNLLKWTNYVFGWRQRYFVLKGSVLLYYIRKGDRAKGKIHLSVSTLNVTNNDYRFEIDTGTSIFYLRAETKEKKDEWIKALKFAKFEAESKLQNNPNNPNNNINIGNSMNRMGNESCIDTNRLSLTPDDKLTKKIIFIKGLSENMGNMHIELENYLKQNKHEIKPDIYSHLMNFLTNIKKENILIDSSIDEMKQILIRFARDFTRLSEYFGPDDYDRNMNDIENINTAKNAAYIVKKQDRDRLNEERENKLNSQVIKMNEEVFYGLDDDSFDHKIGSLSSNVNPFASSSKKDKFGTEDLNKTRNSRSDNLIVLKTGGHNLFSNTHLNTNFPKEIELKNTKKGKFYDEAYNSKRTSLPVPRKKINLNVWGILKEAVTKDLSKFCVPVYFNEPLSMLQRFCENFQYAGLLNRAAKDPNPYIRMALVSAFCVGGFAFNVNRTLKFFNPLLSETYEYIDNDLNFRYFGEQVSHHPSITACHAEGDGYSFYTNSNSAYKFLLMKGCLEFYPLGRSYITFENFNETITYTKPIAVCRNLIMGTMHLDTYGKITINNQKTGDTLELEILEENKKERGKMIGEAKDIYGSTQMRLEGNMHSHLDIFYDDPITGKEIKERIWEKIKIEGDEESRFYFTDFTINLNNLTEELKKVLPPSDSRFRPDQRALEMQDIDLATNEKHRLEEKQRARRKENEKNKIKHKPIYFDETYDDLTGELIYKYKGNYFEDRNTKKFDKFLDLY